MRTQPEYECDADALSDLTEQERDQFEDWMKRMDVEHERMGSPYGPGSLWKQTGVECWLSWWRDGDDPADALAEDLSNAE